MKKIVSCVVFTCVSVASLLSCKSQIIEISFLHTMFGSIGNGGLYEIIDSFNEKHPYIKITHQAKGGFTNLNEFLKEEIEGNNKLPTMAFCYPYQVLDYGEKVADMSFYVNQLSEDEITDFIPGFLNEGRSYRKEGYYSFPFSKSTYNLFYNLDLFEKENLKIPSTWEELWVTCRKIKEKSNDVIPFVFESSSVLFATMCAQRDIPFVSLKDGAGVVDYNNEKAKELLIELKGYHDEGLLYTQNTLDSSEWVSDLFIDSKIAMIVGSTGGTSYFVNRELEFVTGVAPLPQADLLNHKQPFSGPSICFFKDKKISKKETEAAWLFYRWLIDSEHSSYWAIMTGYEPIKYSAYETELYLNHLNKNNEIDVFAKVARVNAQNKIKNGYYSYPIFEDSQQAFNDVGKLIDDTFNEK